MALNAQSFLRTLQDLLPRGLAWNREENSDFTRLLLAIADELCRVNDRAVALLKEFDVREAEELISDWESLLGLPDECSPPATTLEARQNEAHLKLTSLGSLSRQFYIDLAARLGYTITISEYREFKAGISRAGDPLTNGDWVYAWLVSSPESLSIFFRSGVNRAGDPLAIYSDGVLECAINKRKPAHTIVLFSYG